MTEDEAKTKWCPMARLASAAGPYNRNSAGGLGHVETKDIFCIGSQCMLWVWTGTIRVDENGDEVPFPYGHSSKDEEWKMYKKATVQKHGCCGLSNKLG